MNQILNLPPGAYSRVQEKSNLAKAPAPYVVGVQGITLRGEPHKAKYIANSKQFIEEFGGQHPDDNFALSCLLLLNAGVPLYVNRVSHVATPADRSTIAGIKATATITADLNSVSFESKYGGAGYNGRVEVSAAVSERAGHVDITVTLADGTSETVSDVPNTLVTADLPEYSGKFKYINLTAVTGTLPQGSANLTGGNEVVGDIVAADFIGNATAGTGWNAFSDATDVFRMANISMPDPAVDAALSDYVTQRMNNGYPVRAHVATPVGLTGQGMIDYREGTGTYAHTAIDNYLVSFHGGGLRINNPSDTKEQLTIPYLVAQLVSEIQKDSNEGPWRSASGYELGKLKLANLGLDYNLGSIDRTDEFGRVNAKGINVPIVENGYVMQWTNRSGLRDRNKLLAKNNNVDLIVYLMRNIRPLLREANFQPNDPDTWRSLYRSASSLIRGIVERRGIQPGEGLGWVWQGDQDVQNIADVQYNKPEEVEAGIYRIGLLFAPVPTMEYVDLTLTITDSNTLQVLLNS